MVLFLGVFEKLRKVTSTSVMSVCPVIHLRGTAWLFLDGFS